MVARASLLAAAICLAPAGAFVAQFARRAPPTARPCVAARVRVPLALSDDEDESAFRTLGLSPEASYDEIMDSFEELAERYAGDASRLASFEAAKERVLDLRLRQRMAGAKAQYGGELSVEDQKAPPRTPPWAILNEIRKKLIAVPSFAHARKVLTLIGGLTLTTWITPTTSGIVLLVNTASCLGFVYNRGEADVVRDDFGQIGEIRPMKPKPFMLTIAITFSCWITGYLKAKQMVGAMVSPPQSMFPLLRTTTISVLYLIPSLFFKVQTVFND